MKIKLQKKWKALLGAVLLIAGAALQAKVLAAGTSPAADSVLAILQPEDAVPAGAVKLQQSLFTGTGGGGDCANYELLLGAKQKAAELGANLLKVISRKSHSRTQRCDMLEVAFYQSGDPRQAEQSFVWNARRPLHWEDFRGPVRTGATDRIVAETSCGIAVETSLAGTRDAARVYVFNTFDKQKSWVREGSDKPAVLQHERGHWDICELYTRKMQACFNSVKITGAVLQQKVNEIYESVSREYLARQEQYEQDTQHGTIAAEQERWTAMIAQEIAGTSSPGKL